jgi:hypothetical protein
MLALMRAAVVTRVQTELPAAALWDTIPDDPAELPCVIVGLPELRPESETVFDARCSVYVVAERTNGPGVEANLVAYTDAVFAALGGVRGFNTGTDVDAGQVGVLAVDTVLPTRLEIGGQQYPAYSLTVATSLTEC